MQKLTGDDEIGREHHGNPNERLRSLQQFAGKLTGTMKGCERDSKLAALVAEAEELLKNPNSDVYRQAALEDTKRQELDDVFIRFGLLDLDEAALEEDEFLMSEYWQSRPDAPSLHRSVDEEDDEDCDDEGIDANTPDRIEHCIRERERMVMRGSRTMGTPGADLPELSNPQTRFLWRMKNCWGGPPTNANWCPLNHPRYPVLAIRYRRFIVCAASASFKVRMRAPPSGASRTLRGAI